MGKPRKTKPGKRALPATPPGAASPAGHDAASHQRLHRVLEQMRAVVVEVDHDGRYLYVSPSVSQLLGYAPEDYLDRNHFDWIHEEDVPLLRDATRRLQDSGQAIKLAFRVRHKSGHWVWLESTTSRFRTSDGELRTLTFAHDMTEAKRAGEALRESEDRYRTLTQRFSDLIFELDESGRFLFMSQSCSRILGVAPERLVGRSLLDFAKSQLIHPEDRTLLARVIREARDSGPLSGRYEFRIQHPEGNWRWFDCELATYQAQDGSWRAMVTAREVTARVRAQQELRESEERYRLITETTREIISEMDSEGRLIYASAAAVDVLGFEVDELIGTTPFAFVHPEDIERCVEGFLDGVANQTPVRTEPYRVRRKDGSWCWLEGHGLTYTRADGEVRFLAVNRDVSDRVVAEQERRALEERVQQSQRLEGLGVMAGGIAHDFNNLLTPILGDASLALMDLPADSPARARLQRIQKASERAAALTTQMLAYAGKRPLLVEPLDLSGLVRELSQLLEGSVGRRAVLVYDLPNDLPRIEADAAQLSQVVMNLITNAAEACGETGGQITIRAGSAGATATAAAGLTHFGDELPAGTGVYFEVVDEGCGMDEETRARIFDPFFTTKLTGRGLGLAAVLGIVRGHRGAVEIESAPGHGTRFRVVFPATDAVPQDVTPPAAAPDWRGSGTVLVVDDDQGVREIARDVLERAGLTVLCAEDAAAGIELFARHADRIRAVVLDRTMPGAGGEATLDAIRRIRPATPVLLASGYSRERATEDLSGSELAGFLQKPFLPQQLLDEIRRVIEAK